MALASQTGDVIILIEVDTGQLEQVLLERLLASPLGHQSRVYTKLLHPLLHDTRQAVATVVMARQSRSRVRLVGSELWLVEQGAPELP